METWQQPAPGAGPVTRWIGPPPFAQLSSARPDRGEVQRARSPRTKSSAPSGTGVKRSAAVAVQRPMPTRAPARALSTAQVLEQLLRKNLRDGHWRAALRRLFMLEHCDRALASRLREELDVHADRLLPRERERMRSDARAWAEHVALL